MKITVEQVKNYGFDLYEKKRDLYVLFPENVLLEPPWLILERNLYANFEYRYQIIAHRTDELTNKYRGLFVTSEWVMKFCIHHEEAARIKTTHQLKKLKKEEDMLAKKEEDMLAKKEEEQNDPAEKQKLSEDMLNRYKTKQTGYRSGANICPVCNGDGGVRKCYKCEGTGWV